MELEIGNWRDLRIRKVSANKVVVGKDNAHARAIQRVDRQFPRWRIRIGRVYLRSLAVSDRTNANRFNKKQRKLLEALRAYQSRFRFAIGEISVARSSEESDENREALEKRRGEEQKKRGKKGKAPVITRAIPLRPRSP